MKALVTAAASFLGSHLVARLIAEGHQAVAVDNLAGYSAANLEPLLGSQHFLLRVLDVDDSEALADCFPGADWVFHLAGASWTAGCEAPTSREVLRDARATLKLLDCSRRFAVKSLVYASTAESYAPRPPLPLAEGSPLLPRSAAALSAALGEQLVLRWARSTGMAAVSLRLFEVYGPTLAPREENPQRDPIVRAGGARERRHPIEGDKRQLLDFVHISDVTGAALGATQLRVAGDVFNVGSGRPESLERFAQLAGRSPEPALHPTALSPARVADTRKSRRALGWCARVDLADGLRPLRAEPAPAPPRAAADFLGAGSTHA